MGTEQLFLKWGTIKGWDLNCDGPAFAKLKEFGKLSDGMGAMMETPSEEKRELICELIDVLDSDTIINDWSGKEMTKDEAKAYVREYRA